MNAHNVTRLLTYLEQLKTEGEEDKWDMTQYLSDRGCHESLFPAEVTNWHCGTAGCLAGSWAILKVKDGGAPPDTASDLVREFGDDFDLTYVRRCDVVNGRWSPNGIYATLDEAIAYLRLCLEKDRMDVTLG
jgi:hypothetical protein